MSPKLPGGGLLDAVLDRNVMGLADKGGASGLVGLRWADLCAAHVEAWGGQTLFVPVASGSGSAGAQASHDALPPEPSPVRQHVVDRVVRIDDTPEIGAKAASKAMQNPDFFIIGRHGERQTLQAADAKFSVETARAKQVSSEVLSNLLTLGPIIDDVLGDLHDPVLLDGLFLCPDFPLTHLMLRRRHGIVRSTVRPDQVEMFAVSGSEFFDVVPGQSIMPPLADLDRLPVSINGSLLAALYYFRLARAAGGCWLDATGPLLTFGDPRVMDENIIREEVLARSADARSAWDLILRWNQDVQAIRQQRLDVEDAAGLPILNRDLRDLIVRLAAAHGGEAPSSNKVRRRVGKWHRARLREEFGPILPPVGDLAPILRSIRRFSAGISAELREETVRTVTSILDASAESPQVVAAPGDEQGP